jgi:outer membrane protein, multidrug efflux system
MNKIINALLILLLSIVAESCTVSKDIDTPTPKLPVTYRGVETVDTTNIANIDWQTFFTDADLRALIDSAIRNNYDLQVAIKNIDAAQLVLKQSKLAYLPDADLLIGASINRPSDNSLNGLSLKNFLGKSYVEDYSASAAISWEADIWGKIRNQRKAALASFLQTTEARKAIQTNLVSNIASGYFRLLMLDAQLDIAKRNLRLNDSTLRIIRLQYDAGQVTALAVQQASAQRLVAAQLVPSLEQEIAIQENGLSVLVAVPPASINRTARLTNIVVPDSIASGVPAALLDNRPDIRSAALAVTVANAETGISKAAMYPSIRITAAGGINAFRASNWFNIPAALFGTVAGGLTQPLFERKQLRTRYEISKIEREKTVLRFRQSVLSAVGEVSDALVQTTNLKAAENIARERIDTLQQAIVNADLLFRNGMANYLEVITAQSNTLQGELELASLRKQRLDATVELYRALGGGWK